MRYLSVCSGIEAATVAWHNLGWLPVAFAEIDPFASAVLAYHYPHVPNLGDFTQITREHIEALGGVNLLVGGPPCQDYSVAGPRYGMNGARGLLSLAFCALARELDVKHVIFENVPGLLSSTNGSDFARLIGELTGWTPPVPQEGWRSAGIAWGPRYGLAWRILDAQHFGVPQRRRRVFLIAVRGDWRTPLAALWYLERQAGMGGWAEHVYASTLTPVNTIAAYARPGWKRLMSADISRSAEGGIRGGCVSLRLPEIPDLESTVSSRLHDVLEPYTPQLEPYVLSETARRGMRARAHQHGKRLPLALDIALSAIAGENENMPLLLDTNASGADVPFALKSSYFTRGKDGAPSFITPPLTAEADRGDQDILVLQPLTSKGKQTYVVAKATESVAFIQNQREEVRIQSIAGALTADQGSHQQTFVMQCVGFASSTQQVSYIVRRLTPRECERLQGFPDDWTCIPYSPSRSRQSSPRTAANGTRYKAVGNSMAVPCMRWIGQRLNVVSATEPVIQYETTTNWHWHYRKDTRNAL